MPNWCSNSIEITSSKEKIDEFEKFLNEKDGKSWFDFFVEPVAEDDENWYQHNLDKYGCKWNCDAQDWTREGDTISTLMVVNGTVMHKTGHGKVIQSRFGLIRHGHRQRICMRPL